MMQPFETEDAKGWYLRYTFEELMSKADVLLGACHRATDPYMASLWYGMAHSLVTRANDMAIEDAFYAVG
jgi:hypothetical protein